MKNVRRKDREIPSHEAEELLARGEYGVLSTVDEEGQPYGVPLNYAYSDNSVYLHCAVDGQKLDNLETNAKVSFCVVGETELLPDKFATKYESAVAFGIATEIHGAERHRALVWLLEKYCADFIEEGKQYMGLKDQATKVIKIEISRISGKARR